MYSLRFSYVMIFFAEVDLLMCAFLQFVIAKPGCEITMKIRIILKFINIFTFLVIFVHLFFCDNINLIIVSLYIIHCML